LHTDAHSLPRPTDAPSLSFLFNAPAPTELYPLSLHDALPICHATRGARGGLDLFDDALAALLRIHQHLRPAQRLDVVAGHRDPQDRKSTRLNSSHVKISYAVFCLKKKKKQTKRQRNQISGNIQ